MNPKEFKKRLNYVSALQSITSKDLSSFFENEQIVTVTKDKNGYCQWDNLRVLKLFNGCNPLLSAIYNEACEKEADFDCRDVVKKNIINEINEYGKFSDLHMKFLEMMKIDVRSLDLIKKDEEGAIYSPNQMFDFDFEYLDSKKQTKDFIKSLSSPCMAEISYGDTLKWESSAVKKDRRSFSLYILISELMKRWETHLNNSVVNLDISGLLKFALLTQIKFEYLHNLEKSPLLKKIGLDLLLNYYDLDKDKLKSDGTSQISANITELLSKNGFDCSIGIEAMFSDRDLIENLDQINDKSANTFLTISFDDLFGDKPESFKRAVSKCLSLISELQPVSFLSEHLSIEEEIASGIIAPGGASFKVTTFIDGFGPNAQEIENFLKFTG